VNLATLPSFPCNADKSPITARGFKDAKSTSLRCADVDPEGIGWFDEVPIPATRHQLTKRGGLHVFFKHAEGLRNSSGRVAAGVDVRADGGFIIDWQREGFDCLWPELLVEWPARLLRPLKPPAKPFVEYHH